MLGISLGFRFGSSRPVPAMKGQVPGRILAIDPGTKRIGYALSDELQLIARPLEVWTRRGREADLAHLRQLVVRYEVVEVLVGVPYRLDGSSSPATERAEAFKDAVAAALPECPVRVRDEALTTWAADERLREHGVHWRDRKGKRDAYAAAALLEEELGHRHEQAQASDPGGGGP